MCQCKRPKRYKFDPWRGKIPWRRKWLPVSVFLSGKIPWTEDLVGYSPWDPNESDTTEQLNTHTHILITTELKFLKIAITLFLNWVSLELNTNILNSAWHLVNKESFPGHMGSVAKPHRRVRLYQMSPSVKQTTELFFCSIAWISVWIRQIEKIPWLLTATACFLNFVFLPHLITAVNKRIHISKG